MKRINKISRSEYFVYDAAAVTLGVILTVFLVFTAKYGVSAPDESYYYTVAHRLTLGEKMIADEWNLAQLVHLFNLLPNMLYIKLAGGTGGLILFMRYLFIAINSIFYGYVYIKLRRFKIWGVAAAFLFSAVIQQSLLTIAYFTAAPMAILAVCLILTVDEKEKSVPKLIFTGFIMACGILAEPFLIVIFLMWFVITVVRELQISKGKPFLTDHAFVLNRRTFVSVTIGAIALFIPYMTYLILSGSFEGLSRALPYLTSGMEYNSENLIDLEKVISAIGYYGIPFVAGSAVSVLAAAFYRIKKMTGIKAKRIIFVFACMFLAGGYVYAAAGTFGKRDPGAWVAFFQYNNFTLLLFSPVLWLLCGKKTPRLFTLWLIGMLFSVLVDISSTVILASGGGLVRVACVLQLPHLLNELRDAPKTEKQKKTSLKSKNSFSALKSVAAVCAVIAIMWNLSYVFCEGFRKPWEFLFSNKPMNCEITQGPFKGLYTNEAVKQVYDNTLSDLDMILQKNKNVFPVAVADLVPFAYLYMDVPYGSYSAWYEYDEPERLAAYWSLRPGQQPAFIYVPYYDKFSFAMQTDEYLSEKLKGLMQFVSGEVFKGKAGYIITVEKLITP